MSTSEVKDAVRARDNYVCTSCGMTNAESVERYGCSLDVHRLVPRSPYTVEGAVTLCKACHGPQPRGSSDEPDCGSGKPVYRFCLYLDDATEERLQKFLATQRVAPARAAVALQALKEFLAAELKLPL